MLIWFRHLYAALRGYRGQAEWSGRAAAVIADMRAKTVAYRKELDQYPGAPPTIGYQVMDERLVSVYQALELILERLDGK